MPIGRKRKRRGCDRAGNTGGIYFYKKVLGNQLSYSRYKTLPLPMQLKILYRNVYALTGLHASEAQFIQMHTAPAQLMQIPMQVNKVEACQQLLLLPDKKGRQENQQPAEPHQYSPSLAHQHPLQSLVWVYHPTHWKVVDMLKTQGRDDLTGVAHPGRNTSHGDFQRPLQIGTDRLAAPVTLEQFHLKIVERVNIRLSHCQ